MAGLLSLALSAPLPSRAQAIAVKDYTGAVVDASHPVYINPDNQYEWPMPVVDVNISGINCGDQIVVNVNMSWTDPFTGYKTQWGASQSVKATGSSADVVFSGEGGWELATYEHANDESEGGSATVSWTLNGYTEPESPSFNILGKQDPSSTETTVDSFYSSLGPPWFWGYILDYESTGGQQYATSTGYPFVVGNPDGIGISQIDGTQNAVIDEDYWNYEANIEDGLSVLDGKKTESQNSWTTNYRDSGNTDPSSYDQNNPYPDCHFVTNTEPLGNSSFGDADWIQDYNTHSNQHWYLWWNSTTHAWNFKYNTSEHGYDYVPRSYCKTLRKTIMKQAIWKNAL